MEKIEWKDASKERPEEGQAVLVASFNKSRPTDIICNICKYEDGRFWSIFDYKGREPETNMVVIDCKLRYEVQDARAWCEAKAVFQDAGKFFVKQPNED